MKNKKEKNPIWAYLRGYLSYTLLLVFFGAFWILDMFHAFKIENGELKLIANLIDGSFFFGLMIFCAYDFQTKLRLKDMTKKMDLMMRLLIKSNPNSEYEKEMYEKILSLEEAATREDIANFEKGLNKVSKENVKDSTERIMNKIDAASEIKKRINEIDQPAKTIIKTYYTPMMMLEGLISFYRKDMREGDELIIAETSIHSYNIVAVNSFGKSEINTVYTIEDAVTEAESYYQEYKLIKENADAFE